MMMSSILFFKRNIVYLPEDLQVEILSRVSVASLARFRCVCKEWNVLIKKDKRLDKKPKILMLIDSRVCLASIDPRESVDDVIKVTSQFSLKDPLKDFSKEVDINYISHYDGLLLCITEDDRLVVWNPCSGETSWIQRGNSYYSSDIYAIGKSSSNKYKILRKRQRPRTFYFSDLWYLEYEIYDFTSNSWRGVGQAKDKYAHGLGCVISSVNGSAYWPACSCPKKFPTTDILRSFDFSTERFGSVSLPDDYHCDGVTVLSVTREEQKLCLASRRDGEFHIDIWMATKIESTGAASWRKLLIRVEQDVDRRVFVFHYRMDFLVDQENKVLMWPGNSTNSSRFFHIIGDEKYIEVDHHKAGDICSLVVNYVPTFARIK